MKRILILSALFAVGCAAALTLNVTRASAWDIGNLPPGYTIGVLGNASPGPNDCVTSYVISGYGSTVTIGYGKTPNGFYDCNPSFQQQLDAFINATYTAPPTTTAATTTTAAPAAPPVTTTVVQTVTDQAGATTTVASTTTVSVVEQSLQAQIDALAAQIAALTDRVTRLEKAGDASWLAFEQAIAGGADPASAAATARGTWLNVVNQLGAFAPA